MYRRAFFRISGRKMGSDLKGPDEVSCFADVSAVVVENARLNICGYTR